MFDANSSFRSTRLGFFDYAKQRLVIGSSSSKIPGCLVSEPSWGHDLSCAVYKLLGNKGHPL